VTAATVNEAEKKAYIAITPTQGGVSVILTQPMTDDALADYKAQATHTSATPAASRGGRYPAHLSSLSG
jgi:hypothetical protein